MTRSRANRNAAVLASDTSRAAERMQIDLWRRMSPLEKAELLAAISRAAQELSLAGIRRRFPAASEPECLMRLAVLKLGSALAHRAYPEATVPRHS
ncbi:MAG: hypothetical protein ACRDGR_10300 [bacterium]